MSALKGPGAAETHDGSSLRIAIVHARWNDAIIQALVSGAKRTMKEAGVREENIVVQSVPGSYELPFAVESAYAASRFQAITPAASTAPGSGSGTIDLLSTTSPTATTSTTPETTSTSAPPNATTQPIASTAPFDAIIAIGVLIKGETMHFEYIADAVSHALMRVQMEKNVPVIFGLLTVLNEQQGFARAGLGEGEKKGHNHGEDWGRAAVELGVKRRGWAEGKFL
ncbi:6,7-dimethyl-8-ribityllumazine synthase [Helicocarpus griseus UAMH5409]|uniref:6,7-dimethyl-8-ribityllumazine synthase n=1 Tax=Helicocarpus griseus UAMH5409 TaxID=1447875 RepID=A0A2B7YCZ7_9EURO|nr:6,7-dimethyl-8-ribityllumazine synthase [Helicocarpus griseus UAMH5409]